MVKYTKERLLKHQMVVQVSNCESHIKNGCKLQEGVVSILNFFSTIPKENTSVMKWFSCNGLDSAIHKAYISCVFIHTTHGGAPRRDIIARDLFLTKFPFDKPVKYKNLSKEELQLLDKELIQIGPKGGFNNKKVFEGLCQVMAQVADRKQHKKGLQNQFSDFLVILASLSPQAYNIFRQNFAGRAIQNIRLHRKYSPFALHNPELCFENIVQVKRLVDTIKYAGPIIAISDNTKLKERLGFSFLYGYIVGSTLLTKLTKVSSYEDIYKIIETINSHNAIASQVRIYLLQ
ncbi:45195_t:CDS:2, partial [Gigaspora margarita]